ncbi:MAG TPA: hypothetical protein PKY05_00930, partial [Fibrobacteria bacterium]|nr:hypothetical protein [Fibrobacteria bacterium]
NSIEYLVDILRMDLASLPSPKASRVGLVDTGTIVLFSCDSSGVTIQTSKDTALGWSSLQTNALGIQTSTSLWVRATKPMHTPSPAVKFNWFLKTVGLPAPRVSLASGPVDSSQTALLACDSMGVSYQWSADTTLGWTSMDADTFVVSQAGSYWFRAVKPRHNASPAVRMTWTIRGLEADAQEPDNSRQTAVLIAANGPAVFHSIMPGDEDWVRFNMPAGKAFRVSASGRPDLTVELFRDTATKPATLDSGTIVSRTILNTATIRWYARISGSGGSTGSYKVQLASWDSAAADASEPDDDRSAAVPYPLKYVLNRTIHSTTDQDWLYWTSSVGRTGTITLTGSINPKLELFREGTEDPIDVSATGSNSVRYVSGMAQRFYLRVTGANGSIGTYQLELDSRDTTLPDEFDPCEPNNTPGTAYPITLGTPLSAKSDVGTDWFVTPTLSPGSYQIRFAAGDMWNCAFVAYTATQDGETIATKTLQACSGGTWTQVFSVPATGPVRIQIGNFLADTDYTITLTKK